MINIVIAFIIGYFIGVFTGVFIIALFTADKHGYTNDFIKDGDLDES